MKKTYSEILYQIYSIVIFIALIASFLVLLDAIINDKKKSIYPWDFAMLLAIFLSMQYVR
jgi:hypothetical protein